MEERFSHSPVLLKEVIGFLNPAPGDLIIDATIGGAGHAEEILRRIIPGGMLIGIDRDEESLRIASERLKPFEGSFKLVNKNFTHIEQILKDIGVRQADGILFDLGISSIQMEGWERGFSIKHNGPLDMRMDRNQRLTAKELVNSLSEKELADLIRNFGEERFYKRISRRIIEERKRKEISTTFELAELIYTTIPYYNRSKSKIHPATRTFQAIRISVNDEIGSIDQALKESPYALKKGARLCVISFHSLEDRIVKSVFKALAVKGNFNILTKKPMMADRGETLKNPRSRSAKLRVIERV